MNGTIYVYVYVKYGSNGMHLHAYKYLNNQCLFLSLVSLFLSTKRRYILRTGLCLFLLVLFLVAMTFLWFHHPMNREELEKLYLIMEDFAERCQQEMTSQEYPRCFKPC